MQEGQTKFGDYTILNKVGEGAMSNVYRCLNEKTFEVKAIKSLKALSRTETHLKMFADEINISKKMEHKNITKVYSGDIMNGYLVMEYVDGVSLEQYAEPETLLPLKEVLSIIRQTAVALQYANTHHIVHRDVKPANIILKKNGSIKITDFGCAVPKGELAYSIAGSLAYMSPEQLDGEALDFHADLYALGMVTYRFLTGKSPFIVDSDWDLKTAIMSFPPTPIEKYRFGLPKSLIQMINRSIEKDSKNRQESWVAFIHEIESVLLEINMDVSYEYLDQMRGFSGESVSVWERVPSRQEYSESTRYSLSRFSISAIKC